MLNTLIVAVAGGSCSGKTTTVEYLKSIFGPANCRIIGQDSYYFNNAGVISPEIPNFDIPQAIDFDLLASHLRSLRAGNTVNIPIYDFVTHTRIGFEASGDLCPIVIVDGTLVLHAESLVELLDFKIFVECKESVRLNRRLARDTVSRGRTASSVKKQFASQVSPMHNLYVEPSKRHADLIINQDDCNDILTSRSLKILEPLFLLTAKKITDSNFSLPAVS